MKTKLLVPIIGGIFLLVATIITVIYNDNSSTQPSNITVQVKPEIDNSTNIDEVENLTINQY
jgi:hypothetical protein